MVESVGVGRSFLPLDVIRHRRIYSPEAGSAPTVTTIDIILRFGRSRKVFRRLCPINGLGENSPSGTSSTTTDRGRFTSVTCPEAWAETLIDTGEPWACTDGVPTLPIRKVIISLILAIGCWPRTGVVRGQDAVSDAAARSGQCRRRTGKTRSNVGTARPHRSGAQGPQPGAGPEWETQARKGPGKGRRSTA